MTETIGTVTNGDIYKITSMEDKLILLKRKYPTEYEIHRNEIDRTRNLILTTTDLEFAEKLVNSYNNIKP